MKPRKTLENVSAYPISSIRRRGKIRLDLNESTRGCSPKVLAALREIQWEDVGAYPEYHDLKAQIAEFHHIRAEQLLLTNGADDGIRTLMQTYIDPGDELILADPTFGIIAIHAKVMGATLKPVPYAADLAFPTVGFLDAITQHTRLIAIVRPDSPTGAVISREALRQLLQGAPRALVMLDETYHHFLGESLINWIDEFPNLIIMQSFSKAYCLAGLRCGFVAANPAIIREMSKVDPPFSLNNLGVIAVRAALADTAHLTWVVNDVRREKAWLIEQFQSLELPVRDSAANFILVNFGESSKAVVDALIERDILIKSLDKIPLLRGWVRIAVGTREEHRAVLQALRLCI